MAVSAVPIDRIREHPDNIRTVLTGLDSLAASIRAKGVQVPLLAHRKYKHAPGSQDLELIYGHRRLAAAQIAGLSRVPCEVRPFMTDEEILLLMLAEAQREQPDPGGVAGGVEKLRVRHGLTMLQIAERLGTSEAQVRAWSRGQGTLPEVPILAPNTPTPKHPAAGRLAPSTESRPRAAPRRLGSKRVPQVPVDRLHCLLAEHDAGRLSAATLVTRVRGIVGGWEPPGGRYGRG